MVLGTGGQDGSEAVVRVMGLSGRPKFEGERV